jgi:replicative DNA helicase
MFLGSTVEPEMAILGSVLIDNAIMDRWGDRVEPSDFANRVHGHIWRMFRALWRRGEPIDLVTLTQRFPRRVQKIGPKKLADAQFYAVTAERVDEHFERILEFSRRRKLMREVRTAYEDLANPEKEFAAVVNRLQTVSVSAIPQPDQITDLAGWYEHIALLKADPNRAWGLRTGWNDLDRLTLGWQKKDLIVVGGRTSMGKSAFALETVLRIAKQGYQVAYFSLEMSREQIYNRMAANLCRIPLQKLRSGEITDDDLRQIAKEALPVMQRVYVEDTRGVTAEWIAGQMRRLQYDRGLDFAVVDYMGEIAEPTQPGDNAGSALYRVTRKLRQAARELEIPIMALSQIVRGVEARAEKRPSLADLSGSTGIEAGADVVILLYREEYYNPDTDKKHILEVSVAKQRNGPTGRVELYYDPSTQRIESLETRR